MKFNKLYIKRSPKLMIIPMIDIIFFLLVFFMMNTLYMFEQDVIPIHLPQGTTAQSNQAAFIPITLTSQGTILFDKEEIPRQAVVSRIQGELSRDSGTAFLLRGDRQVEYGNVILLLDELKKSGVVKIAIATESK